MKFLAILSVATVVVSAVILHILWSVPILSHGGLMRLVLWNLMLAAFVTFAIASLLTILTISILGLMKLRELVTGILSGRLPGRLQELIGQKNLSGSKPLRKK